MTRRLTLLMLTAAAMWCVGCSADPVTGESRLMLISTEQEIAMGEEAAPEFEQEFGGLVNDATLQNYVNQVGMRVANVSHRKDLTYKFGLLKSDIPNAFALPGGRVYVTAGLMRAMENERELSAVLGHEVGHINAQHSVEQMQKQIGMSALLEVAAAVIGGSAGEKAKAAGTIAANMATLKYSRNDEYEADKLGVTYTSRADINPYGMVELLKVLYRMHEEEPGTFGEMFQTHPLTSKRIEEAEAYIQENHPDANPGEPDPNAARFQTMQKRLK